MKLPLQEKERVVVKTREHARVLRQPFVALLLLSAICAFLVGYFTRDDLSEWLRANTSVILVLIAILWVVLVLIWCVAPLLRWSRSRIVLTNQRIFYRSSTNAGRMQSLGLYSVRDVVAHVKHGQAERRPGTLDIVLQHGYVRLTNVPAVGYFRELTMEHMMRLRQEIRGGRRDELNSEGLGA
ncbi:hypothetical protein [Glutamicibacter sp. PS]|uniref:hypothetical protein n=1 Tax=Glutamicibacter sp. PS TaxID=3075634 RepID=UPI00283E1451|nr:hypothetical protein [Glutamicibacter sp. PS]MDR4533554.1 hypothetical protein [Glutamicibacter sp. PS]